MICERTTTAAIELANTANRAMTLEAKKHNQTSSLDYFTRQAI